MVGGDFVLNKIMRIHELTEAAHDLSPLFILGYGWVMAFRDHAVDRALERGMPREVFFALMKKAMRIPGLENQVNVGQSFWVRDRELNMSMAIKRTRMKINDPDNVAPQHMALLKQPDFKGYLQVATVLVGKVPMHDSNTTTYPVSVA